MKFPYNRVLEIKKRYQRGELPREEAKEQLAYLLDLKDDNDFCAEAIPENVRNDYYQSYGPLVRLSDVCNTLRLWARTYTTPLPTDSDHKTEDRDYLREAWGYVELQISKSCLLNRLFFQTETLRTTPCPEHEGRWSGCAWSGTPCACQNGANVTGWLPNEEDTGYSDDPNAPLCDFCGKPPLKQGMWSTRVDGKRGHPECMDANPYSQKTQEK